MLMFITLFQVQFYNYYLARTTSNGQGISLLRLMQFITMNIEIIFMNTFEDKFNSEEFLFEQINYHCLYESRNDRVNFHQKLLKLS